MQEGSGLGREVVVLCLTLTLLRNGVSVIRPKANNTRVLVGPGGNDILLEAVKESDDLEVGRYASCETAVEQLPVPPV